MNSPISVGLQNGSGDVNGNNPAFNSSGVVGANLLGSQRGMAFIGAQ